MENFTTFKKYPDADDAGALHQFLQGNGIESLIVDNSPTIGSSFSGEHLKEYEVQVKKEDFTKAETLLINQAKEQLGDLPEGHYLLAFTDEELYDLILKHDEWSDHDYLHARKLLEQRGKPIDDEMINSLRKQRMADLARPEEGQQGWIVFGYVMALLGGFFGIITGYVLWSARKTLPNGETVYSYSNKDRAHGKNILILGCIILPVSIIIKLLAYSK